MDILVVLLIIIGVIVKSKKKKEGVHGEVQSSSKNTNRTGNDRAYQRSVRNTAGAGNAVRPAKNTAKTGNDLQSASKKKRTDTYQKPAKPQTIEKSILEQAKEHVMAYEADVLQRKDEMLHEEYKRQSFERDGMDVSHLMEEVNDLIVKGYNGELHFERDFVAEGMDMLTRIQTDSYIKSGEV